MKVLQFPTGEVKKITFLRGGETHPSRACRAERNADAIADGLEKIAGHIRAREAESQPYGVLLVLMSEDGTETAHIGAAYAEILKGIQDATNAMHIKMAERSAKFVQYGNPKVKE